MKSKSIDNLEIFTFDLFDKYGIRHFITSRGGGYSTKGYSSLNLGLHTKDSKQLVVKNREKLASALNLNPQNFYIPHQIHEDKIKFIKSEDRGCGFYNQNETLQGFDALITSSLKKVLVVNGADCTPILVSTKDKKHIAALHAGWRGTKAKILKKVLNYFVNTLDIKKEDILVGIAPAICLSCYEVSKELYFDFSKEFQGFMDVLEHNEKGYFLDIKMINSNIATEFGIPMENIEVSKYCTKCDNKLFYSHRVDNECGRFWSGIYKEE